jgi:hypothetical protein
MGNYTPRRSRRSDEEKKREILRVPDTPESLTSDETISLLDPATLSSAGA